ncbi:MAG: 1-deoxy-D-xylulose-5-phosphate synthase [Bacteroidales bacterium]|nr:1-deoxy-D-xylulose-5-phosphate synthase [Bacteroidales bacterium]MBP8678338.1 1-deoxy-D-xylulose-5-phosphate synthase [Bacteroidales bacterium]MBP9978076.1 1-deoxy-D-xylulose-5-phosphate synthase [Bacteroidales bacterium]
MELNDMKYLNKIDSPSDLKRLSPDQLPELCSEIREFIISSCAENPGHIGASLGTVELTVVLHYLYKAPKDKIIWDVGHQAYTHKILTGRREAFINNRKYKGISGFPKISESPYDAFGVGHSSTSISAALGMAVAASLEGSDEQVVAVIGDGALTGGLAYEGLNNAGANKNNILVILNDNQISIDPNVGAMHNYLIKFTTSHFYNKTKKRVWKYLGSEKLRDLAGKFLFSTKAAFFKSGSVFESLGFRYFGVIDGHNIEQLMTTIAQLKNIDGPKLLHIVTKKGKGYKPAEDDQVVWHSPGNFDKNTGLRKSNGSAVADRYQDVFGETLLELAKINTSIVGVTPAMPSGCSMNIVMKEIPERSFDVGIAEQHAVTFSAGMAAKGLLPYCNIYSSFMQRAFDSVIHDVATQNLKVVFCLDRGGLVGEDGATHHGAYDLSYMRCIPGMTIAAPMNEAELRNMLYSAQLPSWGMSTIRYPRGNGEGVPWKSLPFEEIIPGTSRLLNDGEGVAVITIGTTGNAAAEAIEEAKERGANPMHIDLRFLKPFDEDAVLKAAARCKRIITVEDGAILGGLYSAISEFVASRSLNVKVEGLGIPDQFIEQGTIPQLKAECGYDKEGILKSILNEPSHR